MNETMKTEKNMQRNIGNLLRFLRVCCDPHCMAILHKQLFYIKLHSRGNEIDEVFGYE